VSCLTIPGNRIASGSSSGMIFIHSIESSVLIMKWHIDDVMFGYGEGLRTEYRSEALLSQTQLQSLKPQDYTNNRNKILADKASSFNVFRIMFDHNLCCYRSFSLTSLQIKNLIEKTIHVSSCVAVMTGTYELGV
jgi:hypothetical protein